MTGLNPKTDTILSISCLLTNSSLEPLESQGFNAVISHTESQLKAMSQWCIENHGRTGLTQACIHSTTTAQQASQALLAYINTYIPDSGRALLAGNSIHADKSFLTVPPWDIILEHLHYRLFDVSAMKEMVRRWASDDIVALAPRKKLAHTAQDDVRESLEEARFYMQLIQGMGVPKSWQSSLMGVRGGGGAEAAFGSGRDRGESFGFDPVDRSGALPRAPFNAKVPPQAGAISAAGIKGANDSVSNTGAAFDPSSRNSTANAKSFPRMTAGTKQGQEELDKQRNNGNRDGDVGTLDQGFRTDVP